MTMTSHTDPFGGVMSLRDAVNQLLAESFVAPFNALRPTSMIPVDVFETADTFVVKAFIAGLTPDQVNVSIEQNTVTIQGEPQLNEPDGFRTIWAETSFGPFTRSFTVPLPVDANKVQAELENGVLTLTLPKAESVKPRKIQIKASQGEA